MNCPSCGSTNTKRLSLVYASGTSTSRSSSFWITSKGRLGTRSGRGTRQSKLAEAASPPRGPSLILGFIGMVIVACALGYILSALIPVIVANIPSPQQAAAFRRYSPLIIPTATLVVFLIWVVRHRMKRRRYARRIAAWELSWLCQKCGSMWVG